LIIVPSPAAEVVACWARRPPRLDRAAGGPAATQPRPGADDRPAAGMDRARRAAVPRDDALAAIFGQHRELSQSALSKRPGGLTPVTAGSTRPLQSQRESRPATARSIMSAAG